MARKKNSTATNKGGADNRVPLKEASSGKRSGSQAEASQTAAKERREIIQPSMRNDALGTLLVLIGVILLIMAFLTPSGIVTSVLSSAIHHAFGFGSYLVPIFFFVFGGSFFVKSSSDSFAIRLGIGSALILLGILAIGSLLTPNIDAQEALVFEEATMTSRGGLLGGAIAFLLCTLLGQIISIVVCIGLVIGGAIIIGFSISNLVQKAQIKTNQLRDQRRERAAQNLSERERRAQEQAEIIAQRDRERSAYDDYEALDEGPARSRARAANSMYEEPDYDPLQGRARIRRHKPSTVPRDLSRPQRASGPIGSGKTYVGDVVGGPNASALDMYWPSEYAYGSAPTVSLKEADSSFNDRAQEQQQLETDKMTRKLKRTNSEPGSDGDGLDGLEAESGGESSKTTVSLSKGGSSSTRPAAQRTRRIKRETQKAPELKIEVGDVRDGFALPALSVLKTSDGSGKKTTEVELRDTAMLLQETLADFGILANVVGWVSGPTVTLFKVDLPSGVRVSKITNLENDIALALAAPGVRIFAPIPGTNYVGIEVPNKVRQTVLLGDIIPSVSGGPLEMSVGMDVEGRSIVADLASMPHLLIAGTTGSGKSVTVNSMIMTILMRSTPDEVRLIMIDPKRVEFTLYNGIPHLYVPVVTDPKEAASALSWAVAEMDLRLKTLSSVGARNISQYNEKVLNGELDEEGKEPAKKLPYIVIVIDELADLMMNMGKEVENSISRLAAVARAAGIHLILATQRPSTNVVTGVIKANITCRMALNVASGIDSRVILDSPGAEKLLNHGDMLFSKPEFTKPVRLQSCYVSEEEITAVVNFLKDQGTPEYHQEILSMNVITLGASAPDGSGGSSSSLDPLLWEAADLVVSSGLGSTSNIQRRFSVGYARAGRIMDMLEEKGVVGPANGSRPRDVLVDEMELETLKAFEENDGDSAPF